VVIFNWSKLNVDRMALEALEFGKRALAVENLQRETVGSCATICILHWKRGSKLPLPLTWCLPRSQVVQNPIFMIFLGFQIFLLH
jgi:hypothetical protein